jgi:hypothetical protein
LGPQCCDVPFTLPLPVAGRATQGRANSRRAACRVRAGRCRPRLHTCCCRCNSATTRVDTSACNVTSLTRRSSACAAYRTRTSYVSIIFETELEPGVMVVRHTHPGIESGYVLEGEFDLPIQGQPTHRLKAGDAYQVPAETPMLALRPSRR